MALALGVGFQPPRRQIRLFRQIRLHFKTIFLTPYLLAVELETKLVTFSAFSIYFFTYGLEISSKQFSQSSHFPIFSLTHFYDTIEKIGPFSHQLCRLGKLIWKIWIICLRIYLIPGWFHFNFLLYERIVKTVDVSFSTNILVTRDSSFTMYTYKQYLSANLKMLIYHSTEYLISPNLQFPGSNPSV